MVPETWYKKCNLYRLETHRKFQQTKKNIFFAFTTESFLNWPLFKSDISDFLKNFDHDSQVTALLLQRSEFFEKTSINQTIPYELSDEIQKRFIKKIDMIPLYEFRMLMTEKDITFVHLDLYRSSMGLCSMQSLMMSGSCQIFPKAYYDGHKGSEIARKAVSFHHDLVMYDFHTTHQDFFDLLFDLKLYEKNLHSTYPIGAMMANLLKKRLSFYRAI